MNKLWINAFGIRALGRILAKKKEILPGCNLQRKYCTRNNVVMYTDDKPSEKLFKN